MSQNEKVATDVERVGKGTGPLSWEQLSDSELATIIEIERRLYEIQAQAEQMQNDKKRTDLSKNEDFPPLEDARQQYERGCLIDGGRGTGKSSLLQTLIERWGDEEKRKALALDKAYKERVESLKAPDFVNNIRDTAIPSFVKVFYLDFDPLPHKMPLMAGIVQAWKSLARYYDKSSGNLEECDDENATLEDQWHALFRVAAVGWSDITHKGGLIEQVLNHEDQVQNWHRLQGEWERFVDRLITAGKCTQNPKYKITDTPVFVIAIDDVDLQVERMRELLPALQNLQHPNVVFIVAADKAHMQDMLQLSFHGQQRRLENLHISEKSDQPNKMDIWPDRKDLWPEVLAQESIRKVFPLRNTWKLRKLSLRELLGFPEGSDREQPNTSNGSRKSFRTYFESWLQQDSKKSGDFGNLAKYFSEMAGNPEDLIQLPPIISYRVADQIFKRVSQLHTESDIKPGALIAIRDILAQPDEELVKIPKQLVTDSKRPKAANEQHVKKDTRLTANIVYQAIGNLQAVFPDVITLETGHDSEIVLSGYPEFRYTYGRSGKLLPPGTPEFTTAFIAGSLRDDGYGVLAPGLQWDIRTAIAWTAARVLEFGLFLTLRWQLHIHPSPLRLYRWSSDWTRFIETLSTEMNEPIPGIVYAWIYYQLKWLGANLPDTEFKLPLESETGDLKSEKWVRLLKENPRHGTGREVHRWKSRTLPLMARPELGLPHDLQKIILKACEGVLEIEWLCDQRERHITDAIIASHYLGVPLPPNPESQHLSRAATDVFDRRHFEIYGEKSPWQEYIGEKRKKR